MNVESKSMKKSITVSFPGGMRADGETEGITIRTDQSVRNGGEGSAPEPFQLFLASIATCAGIYALDFCHVRKISAEEMELTMECDFDPAGGICSKIRLDLKLPEGFPEKYKKAVIRVMDLCAVKKNIINPPEFEIMAQ